MTVQNIAATMDGVTPFPTSTSEAEYRFLNAARCWLKIGQSVFTIPSSDFTIRCVGASITIYGDCVVTVIKEN